MRFDPREEGWFEEVESRLEEDERGRVGVKVDIRSMRTRRSKQPAMRHARH